MTTPAVAVRRREAALVRRLCQVPERLTVTEWADRERMLPETSTAPGPYRSSVVPYARRWQDLLADPTVSTVVLCWASQTTKSTVIENGLAYRICRMPSPILVVRPKQEDAEGWVKERFVPMVNSTPALRERVKLGRSPDSTLRYKRFPGGFLFVPSAGSATELASRSAPVVLVDEADRMEVIPGEGNPIEIVSRRQGAADVGLLVLTSTPRDAETTMIWPYLEEGTFELCEVPCPHCDHRQPLVWARLRWPKGRPELAEYECANPRCGKLIPEREKPGMLAAHEWIPTNPDGAYPSSHLNALYSPFAKSGWGQLAREHDRALGKPADLQVFVNTRLAELWTETQDTLKGASLPVEPLTQGEVPEGVGLLTAGVDVQGDRLELYVWGWGAGLESWLVHFAVLPGDPGKEPDAPGSVWAALDAQLLERFPHAVSGVKVPIAAALVDSGYQSPKVYRFCKARAGRRIHAAKGVETHPHLVGKPSVVTKMRYVLYTIGTDVAKNEFLRSQLLERQPGPGYVHLPDWLTTDQLEQFVAEERKRRIDRGKVTYHWRRKKNDPPNEALDCRILARAALEALGNRTIQELGARAQALAKDPGPAPAEGEARPVRRVKRSSGWMNWRNR